VVQIVGSVGYGDKQVEIPEKGNEIVLKLMRKCLHKNRKERPVFKWICEYLDNAEREKKSISTFYFLNFRYCIKRVR
jgi:hypothetical protein